MLKEVQWVTFCNYAKQNTQMVWTIYVTEAFKEAGYMVLHIWIGHLYTTAYLSDSQDEQTHL